jgi:D-lactate dehydrogenase
MVIAAVYDTKSYDMEQFQRAAAGKEIQWRFLDFRLEADTAASAKGANAACVFVNDKLDRACLQLLAGEGVKLVAFRSAGYNNLDLEAAREFGLRVTRVPVYSPYSVAEHALALLLCLNRKIHRAYNRVRELNFSLNGLVGFDLFGKTAGVIGTGKIGRACAEILLGFKMKVLACDPFPALDWAAEKGVDYLDKTELLRESDVIFLHALLTPETKHLIGRQALSEIKPGAIIINVSRGALIDTTALIEGLKSGRLGGVGLDVYEEEEGIFFEDLSNQVLHDDLLARLLTFPNVLITAHQGFLTNEALSEIARVTAANISALERGESFLDGTVLA